MLLVPLAVERTLLCALWRVHREPRGAGQSTREIDGEREVKRQKIEQDDASQRTFEPVSFVGRRRRKQGKSRSIEVAN